MATGYACIVAPGESPVSQEAGLCTKFCASSANCTPGLVCDFGGGLGVCKANTYTNAWMLNVGARLTTDAGWLSTLRIITSASAGNDHNGVRDYDVGSDNWYDKMILADSTARYEVARAVQSVNQAGRAFYARDDLPSWGTTAQPITVVSASGTPIWWGNGWSYFPNFEDWADRDYALFRGVAGSAYVISADKTGASAADLYIAVERYDTGFPVLVEGSSPSGSSATVTLPAQPTPAWYAVGFRTLGATSGAWTGNVALASGADEYPGYNLLADRHEAYPMATGVSTAGVLQTTGDIDAFRLESWANTDGVSVSATPTSGPALTIDLYDTDGDLCSSGTGLRSCNDGNGRYVWRVRGTATAMRSYTTVGAVTCLPGYPNCDNPTSVPTSVTEAWGGRFAGRLLPTWTARYTMTLAQNQHASFGIVDKADTSGCQIQMDVTGPTALATFGNQRMTRWRDGPAAASPLGAYNGFSAGGHLVAPIAGTYVFDLTNYGGSSSCWYLFFAATNPTVLGPARPTW